MTPESFEAFVTCMRQKGAAAVFTADLRMRYLLGRCWRQSEPVMTWIMLNPSIADEQQNDPTVERCCRRARLHGYGGVIVVNIFAFITPYPWVMKEAHALGDDIIGPHNDAAIVHAARYAKKAVAAWGTDGALASRGTAVRALLASEGIPPYCLGTTKDGHPRRPLYVSYDTELEAFA